MVWGRMHGRKLASLCAKEGLDEKRGGVGRESVSWQRERRRLRTERRNLRGGAMRCLKEKEEEEDEKGRELETGD